VDAVVVGVPDLTLHAGSLAMPSSR
jgi:hypothetical protein